MLINRALFERFDTDADGILSVAELAKLIQLLRATFFCAFNRNEMAGIPLVVECYSRQGTGFILQSAETYRRDSISYGNKGTVGQQSAD
ncbi:hypothetical protein Pmar_PMAR011912 [Perkinsus marinus ATCC 50983]|uniref:EF-hand domain-containing protein n=1 Tax=Perkinsus marinus (strain ATCC 50983 / TXsc) TaxID=423536 RepID=C5LBN8_PERM5|nr:hypothetical protein Pmar_PMAR011912 [Perkinsus marinus ATCC 50983]EER05859.1 hypothetical protein Pmar_PMAR011912 [Perkinsus marinus ATCC 50983]|eukprot:XP_002774043.1 hypothetical protein Pmar_PMAR011912 [Perkinsus marinus ATCC 50983]